MSSATIKSKGRITIPAAVRRALSLESGDRLEFVQIEPDQFLLVASNRSVKELKGMFGHASRAVSVEEMNRFGLDACTSYK